MQNITLEDGVYRAISTEAARHNLDIDTYVSSILLREIGHTIRSEPRSKFESGIGLFADLPDSFDTAMESILDDRDKPWDLHNEESNTRH